MTFRPYTVENLQLQLREYFAQCRAGNGNKVRWDYRDIIRIEERFDGLTRQGYDAERVIADLMAGRDPTAAESERELEREVLELIKCWRKPDE